MIDRSTKLSQYSLLVSRLNTNLDQFQNELSEHVMLKIKQLYPELLLRDQQIYFGYQTIRRLTDNTRLAADVMTG